MAKSTKTPKVTLYTATGDYKKIMSNEGLMTVEQHKDLLKGNEVDLTGVPEKQMIYLTRNGLIKES